MRVTVPSLGVAAAALLLAACGGASRSVEPARSPVTSSTTTAAAPSTPATTAAPTTAAPGTTRPTPTPTPTHVGLQEGDHGPQVLAMQQHLEALGYWLGTPDGSFGDTTQQAVYAVQKAAGLPRDGVAGPATLAAIARGARPSIRSSGSGHRFEIQKDLQLLLIIDGGRISTILNTSTGSGETFTLGGVPTKALTPSGSYRVFRQVDAEDPGPLGALWRPKYFDGPIAIHGLASVPPYPASHGCARVSIAAMDMIWTSNLLPIGTSVTVV